MQYMSSSEARNQLSQTIERAQREPVTIQKQGHDVAVILSPTDYARITKDNIEEFLSFCKTIGRNAQKAGLSEKVLAQLLAETQKK